jgi:hypothetical protein
MTTTLAESVTQSMGQMKKPWLWFVAGTGTLLICAAMAVPSLMRTRGQGLAMRDMTSAQLEAQYPTAPAAVKTKITTFAGYSDLAPAAPIAAPRAEAMVERKIIRTGSLELMVQHPEEVMDKITALANGWGGYLERSEGGGQNATTGTLTIRVPAARFEEARAAIRKLGLRVQSEKINADDVTRQYVDQDASLRNLRAEEAQYLAILKRAGTVKDMLLVTEQLSGVRGQIEQQQAEFNALSRQVETVALTVSLSTEPAAQTFWFNWRPGYELKVALRDGLESLANYATVMMGILFYLPATLLWFGTIAGTLAIGWKAWRWAGRRWFKGGAVAVELKS